MERRNRKETVLRKSFFWNRSPRLFAVGLFSLSLLLSLPQQVSSTDLSALEQCLVSAMETADDDTTMGELRQRCRLKIEKKAKVGPDSAAGSEKKQEGGALDQRLAAEKEQILKPFTLMAHKPNYFLVASYNASGIDPEPYRIQSNNPSLETNSTEAKFQLSIKTPLWVGLFGSRVDIFAAYTNRSFWQVYNDKQSSPFRETDHEPEIWFQSPNDWQFLGFTNRINAFGFVHQSNGRGGTLSRSWNRLYADFLFERGNLVISLKPWYRINEDSDDDDNPDITDYMGHGELRTAYKWCDNTFSLMLRNNLESGFSRGAVEFGWSFPLWKYKFFKGYVQYFNGYGESLIDYNQHSNSIGAGLLLTDWL